MRAPTAQPLQESVDDTEDGCAVADETGCVEAGIGSVKVLEFFSKIEI